MSHYFDVPLSLLIAALTSGMVETAGTGTLIFFRGPALRRPTSLLTALLAAVALPSITRRAHQHLDCTISAHVTACAGHRLSIHSQTPPDSPNARHAACTEPITLGRIRDRHMNNRERHAWLSSAGDASRSNLLGDYCQKCPTWRRFFNTSTLYSAFGSLPSCQVNGSTSVSRGGSIYVSAKGAAAARASAPCTSHPRWLNCSLFWRTGDWSGGC